jgi:hypothetical protein
MTAAYGTGSAFPGRNVHYCRQSPREGSGHRGVDDGPVIGDAA